MEQLKLHRERENKIMDQKNILEEELIQMKNDVEEYHNSRMDEDE